MSDSPRAEVLTIAGNYAVVKLDHRQFPGVMMQGDTFHGLIEDLVEAHGAGGGASKKVLAEVVSRLGDIRRLYEETLRQAGYRLPYERPG